MTSPSAVPKSILYIEGDPAGWGLRDVAPVDPDWDSTPVALAIIGPLTGTLLLSPVHVGSYALLPPPASWVPAQQPVAPFLYLPSATGLASPYTLAASNDNLATLQQDIMDAMRDSTYFPVQVSAAGGGGFVLLNGGVLPFVVLGKAEGNL
jgi:hypothetical protein